MSVPIKERRGGNASKLIAWSTTDKHAAITLANFNCSVTMTGGGWTGGIRTTDFLEGKVVFGLKVLGTGTYVTIGVGTSSASIDGPTAHLGTDAYGWGYRSDGNKLHAGSVTAYGAAFTAGDWIHVGFDKITQSLWFAKNGTWQGSGDPVAGSNAAFTNVSGVVFPMVTFTSSGGSVDGPVFAIVSGFTG
ncbi:SPRY domain-containing protein [Azospirillum sp. ST 5-10]|uniref:SPRY domain-containing protein n=1 Tax=unclassified Azospirillum TaxID=2630922 RepID=UPI003F4A7729